MTEFGFDFETMTTEELAANILDRLRIDLDAADLEGNAPDSQALKFFEAIRLVAKEDPQTLADGFMALSIDCTHMEEELFALNNLIRSYAGADVGVDNLADDVDDWEVN